MKSYKPYRTQAQKALAKKTAKKCEDGAYRSNAPFSFHDVRGEFVWGENGLPLYADSKRPLIDWRG